MNTNTRKFTVFLASIAALTSLSIDMSLPTLPAIEHEFGLRAGAGGLTMSLFLAGYAITPAAGGPLADRFGRRPVLFFSLLAFALSAMACSISPSFPLLLAFRLLQGGASGVATTLPLAIVRDLMRGVAARQRISEVTTINNMMPILAPILGSTVMMLGRWRFLFACQAAFGGCILAALLIDFKESLPAESRSKLDVRTLARNYVQLLRNRTFLSYALINGFTFACMFSFISASPLILMERMGVSRHTFTFQFVVLASGTIAGSFLSVLLSRRHVPSRKVILTGLSLMASSASVAAILQIEQFHRPVFILLPVFCTLFGFGLIAPSVTVAAVEPVPHLAGSASGALRSIFMFFGSGISALLAGYCGRNYGHSEVATTLTMFATATTALLIYLSLLRGATE